MHRTRGLVLPAVAGLSLVAYANLTPLLALHAAAGLFQDLFILLRRAGGLP